MTTIHKISTASLQRRCALPWPYVLLLLLTVNLRVFGATAAEELLDTARLQMRAQEFEAAVKTLDAALAGNLGEAEDAALYLKALALFQDRLLPQSIQVTQKLEKDFPESEWLRKARFLRAGAFAAQKDFENAELIYAQEANRLLSDARKQDVAGVIIEFADNLARKPEPNELDAPPPNYNKAYALYAKALEMEIGRELRDDLMFRRARAIYNTQNWHQAIQDFQTYLQTFDAQWTGPAGTPSRQQLPQENPPPPGEHRLEARLFLASALKNAGNQPRARWESEDLLRILTTKEQGGGKLAADARWLTVQSYGMPQPAPAEIEAAVQAARDFLEHHHSHPQAVQAAYHIAEAYRHVGRSDQAVAAYLEFIEMKNYALPAGEDATARGPAGELSPAELQEQFRQAALYNIGQIRFQQHQYEEAIAAWQKYANQYPNGPHWAASQNGMMDAEFQQGVQALSEKEPAQARAAFQKFLNAHPLDARARHILFIFGQMHYARALELDEAGAEAAAVVEAHENAIDEWAKLISKYPGTEESSLALYRTGIIYEEHLQQLERALDAYRRLNWGSHAAQARQRLAVMTQKELRLATERIFRSNEQASVTLNVRNIDKLTVRIYRLDLEAYFRKMHHLGEVESLDVGLIEPDKVWEVEIDGYEKYRPFKQAVEIPFENDEPGAYVVNVSENDWQAATLVIRSDLDVIVKNSRREALVFAQNMLTQQPVPDVRVLLSDGEAIFATETTGKDGVYHGAHDELKGISAVGVLAIHNGHVASYNMDLSGLQLTTGLSPKGYIYTDRPAYRPGETVAVRAIIREVNGKGEYAVPQDKAFDVLVTDAQGRLLRKETRPLSEFGTFHTEFALPEAAAVGQYTITVRRDPGQGAPLVFTGQFQVQHFQLEKIRLTLEFPRRVYFRGDEVEAKIAAAYYWGEPVANAPLRYSLPDGRSYQTQTDADGMFAVTFDTSSMTPGSALQFTASLEGHNVTVQDSVFLAQLGFSANVTPSQDVVISGEPFDVAVTTIGADGKPVGKEMTLYVLRRETPAPDKVLAGVPWVAPTSEPSAEVTVAEHQLETDPDTGRATLTLTLEKGGLYLLRVAGEDHFGQTVTGRGALTVSDDDDSVKFRLFSDAAKLQVGAEAEVSLHARVPNILALVTFEGEKILRYQILKTTEGHNEIGFEVGHDLFPNFRLAVAGMDGRDLRMASKEFTVERELKVTVKPLQAAYEPGEDGEVELHVTDQLGRPVRAELSLALVNEALFAVYPDTTPKILEFFQKDARRHADFRTGSTCGFEYIGMTRPVLKEILDEADRVVREREDAQRLGQMRDRLSSQLSASGRRVANTPGPDMELRQRGAAPPAPAMRPAEAAGEARRTAEDTVEGGLEAAPRREVRGTGYWLPAVITDDAGRAVVRVPMPETTTEWRLTARGCTPESLVGENTAQTLTRKEFFVDLKLPSVVREGDELRVLTNIHNLTDYNGIVELALTITGAEGDEMPMAQQKQQVEIEPGKGAVVTFDAVKIPDALQLDVQVTATAGDHRDALVTRLPVLPWGLEYADNKGGLGRGDQTVFLNLPEGITYSNRWLTVLIGPVLEKTVIEMALDSGPPIMPLTRLADTRAVPPVEVYGSSVGSELLAAVSGFAYARAHTVPERDVAELRSRCLSLLATLVSTQRDDGAWAWHAGTGAQPDWAATSRAYWALARAREAGLSVHPDAFTKAGAYLENQFRKFSANDNDGKAAVLHALSTSKQADFAHLNRLYRERNSLSNSALAYSALAFINLERREMARELTDLLVSRAAAPADETVPRAYWQHGVKHHPWLQDDLETTALTLLALALVDPESPKAEAAAQYLLQQRGCIGFRPAKARGPAVRALAAYYSTGQEATADYRVTINVNGQELTEVNSAEASTSQVFAIPENMLKDGENTVTFTMVGRGRYTYAATLRGFSAELKDPNSWPRPHIYDRHYYHSRLEYRGRQIGSRSSSPVRHLESGQRTEVFLNFYESHFGGYLIIEEPLPAGTMLVEGSPSGNYTHYEVGQSKITFFYQAGAYPNDIRYELVGYAPGDFRALPTVMRDAMNPGRMRLGKVSQLAVLRPGEVSSDPYHMNYGELFELGRLNFEDGIYDQALEYLTQLFKQNRGYNERDVARMLLWIHTDPRYYDAERIVEMFEILRERYPQLEIPFDKILVVGRAYRDIGEFERAWLVFRATIEASFISDSNVSAVLEDQGRFLGSIDYQGRLWREYPDSAQVVSAYFALSQALYNKAPQAHAMPEETGRKPDRIEMLEDTAGMLTQFLTLYPNDPLADDAAFSLANAYLDLKQYEFVVHLSRRFAEQYAASKLVSSFQYMMALGLFWQRDYEAALEAAQVVATGDSQDKMFAQYIVGQIYHAQGLPGQAIEWYGKVKGQYPDAAEAIGYFEKAAIGLGEINIYRPGEKIELPLEYRNIREAHLQIYRVDLMRLYLREKNLSNISRVHLAGIEPEAEMTVQLGDGKDYVDQDTDIQLDLKDEGAYLVICRGDDLFTSGLVLITPLKVEVQEDAVSGQVRVNVRDVVEETYQADVHVKVVGSEDKEFRSGDTDLRGIFVAGNVRGKATVIAREGEARYAFYRGDQWLGAPAHEPQQQAPQQQPQAAPLDYQRNLRDQNMMMQRENVQQFDQMRRVQQKGVEVQKAF